MKRKSSQDSDQATKKANTETTIPVIPKVDSSEFKYDIVKDIDIKSIDGKEVKTSKGTIKAPMVDISDVPVDGWQKRRAQFITRARLLMNEWKLDDWTLVLIKTKKLAGKCDVNKKKISISSDLIDRDINLEKSMDTMKHEIAHALDQLDLVKKQAEEKLLGTFRLTRKQHHGASWKQWAIKLGIKPERCHTYIFTKSKYIRRCPMGHFEEKLNRLSSVERTCNKCKSKVEYLHSDTRKPVIQVKQIKATYKWWHKCPRGCFKEPILRKKKGQRTCNGCKSYTIYEAYTAKS